MKRQHCVTDSTEGEKQMKMSPDNPSDTNKNAILLSCKADVVLLPELLQKICSLLITEQELTPEREEEAEEPSHEGEEDERPTKEAGSIADRIHVAGINSILRQCVLKHNRETSNTLRVTLDRKRSNVCVDDKFNCDGEVTEQVKTALNFFHPNKLIVVIEDPRLKRAKKLLDALAGVDLTSLKAVKLKIKAEASVSKQLVDCLPFVRQLTHIQLKLRMKSTTGKHISSMLKAIGHCSSLQLFDIDDGNDRFDVDRFDAELFKAVDRSMNHLVQLPKLRTIGLFAWWNWDEQQASLFNKVPGALSTLCLGRCHFFPWSDNKVGERLLSEATRASIETVCCLSCSGPLVPPLVTGIVLNAPNCRKVAFETSSAPGDHLTEEKVHQFCDKLLKMLEDTNDRRMHIELVAPSLLDDLDTDEDLIYTLGKRSIAVTYDPEDDIKCAFDCFK